MFTPLLKDVYGKLKQAGKPFEVVFVSGDQSDGEFKSYFASMPWLAVPYEDRDVEQNLSGMFQVEGIPTLVIVDDKGKPLTTQGRELVTKFGADGFPYTMPHIEELLAKQKADRESKQSLETLLTTDKRDFVVDKSKKETKVADLKGKYVGLYFSASWCGPCKKFTPILTKAYEELKKDKQPFEIVFCSLDKEEDAFGMYFSTMPWLAVPFADRTIIKQLAEHFELEGIPTLVILNPDGKTVTADGVEMIAEKGAKAFPFK
jgi:nucleoredoxin